MAAFALYLLTAAGMLALFAEPQLLPATAPASHDSSLRAMLLAAALLNVAIFGGALARARWARPLALFLHGLAALIALLGLSSLAMGAALFGGEAPELAAKAALHALMTGIWASRWMRAAFSVAH